MAQIKPIQPPPTLDSLIFWERFHVISWVTFKQIETYA